MKYLNTFLLIVLIIAVGVNFYFDHKRDLAMQAVTAHRDSIPAKAEEPSPFDKAPSDPLHSSQSTPTSGLTTISYDRTSVDFGKVESGPKYTAKFKYRNTGHSNLYISSAEASCGCTVATWTTDPLAPGDSSEIVVEFDSRGRTGEQLKTVTVTTNTDPNKNVLTLRAHPYIKQK
jgi:Protein of unknown function (DUF1573)